MNAPVVDRELTTRQLRVTVHGTPAPQGSKKAYVRGRHAVLVESSPAVKPWRQDVVAALVDAIRAAAWQPLDGPVTVEIEFRLRRPASAPKRRTLPDRKPDLDKLARATLDAITTAGAIADDARVVDLALRKRYAPAGEPTGAVITISDLSSGGSDEKETE